MAYTKRIVCLANSYKRRGICIAGREMGPQGFGPWIRPVSSRPTHELHLVDCHCPGVGTPRLLDIVEIAFHSAAPFQHQAENYLIDQTAAWTICGQLPFEHLEALRQQPTTLWIDNDHTASGVNDCITSEEATRETSSLYLIKVRNLIVQVRTGRYTQTKQLRCRFRHGSADYNLSVTDQLTRDRFEHQKPGDYSMIGAPSLYLTISLTTPYTEDGRCHKLVAAILRNPAHSGQA